MNRLHHLDYLRGATACSVMIYHFMLWAYGSFDAGSIPGRIGIYGVGIFYVLSGLTLYHVYQSGLQPTVQEVFRFARKRVLRIFPLLWMVTLGALLLQRSMPDPAALFLNLSGLFGFVSWDTYFSPGVWSIGNELVFYTAFPFFIWSARRHQGYLWVCALLCLLPFCYYAFAILDPAATFDAQWSVYINPLNQIFLFMGGFLAGHLFQHIRISARYRFGILAAGVLIFVFYPASGDLIHLVSGTNRLVFTLSCLLICLACYKMQAPLPAVLHKPLLMLGETSYSVYLLHPLVYQIVAIGCAMLQKAGLALPVPLQLLLSVMLSLLGSYFVYHYFERFFMSLGRAEKWKPVWNKTV